MACFFHSPTIVGWMPCLVANWAVVSSPRSASSATFALKSAEYRFRLLVIQVRPSQERTELKPLSEFAVPPQSQVGPLLDQIGDPIGQVTADGVYDGDPTYQTIAAHGDDIAVVIPPRATAVPSGELDPPTQRDRHLAMITEQGRLAWQATTGYGQQSLVETTIG